MDCEVEFLPVGDASKAGDAIVVRYGNANAYELMVIDGGNIDSGKAVVKHLREQFGKSSILAHLVLTHCDTDHACGLREVLSELPVKNLWLHMPWLSAAAALPYFANKNLTENGLAKKLIEEYDLIADIVKIGLAKNIPIRQPFAGESIGPFTVLSPHQQIYEILLPQFDRTPDADEDAIKARGLWIGKQPNIYSRLFDKLAAKVQRRTRETWNTERLRDGGITSATNESSVVLYGDFGGNGRFLLTGDAGYWGLNLAATFAERQGLPLQNFRFVQIPHHGSRRNVGPTTLNRLLGPIQLEGTASRYAAFVSAPKDDDVHPRQMVLNAFIRRGGRVIATQGGNKVHWGGFPVRAGYVAVTPTSFSSDVEDYD
jgi:beta-lactamase superfamily II metal-dependent hydrolase